jgi:2-polyprenyl-3-methyl-5-hydroxy-6-metoxy-1,4-benzoquinol methylase
MFNIVRFTKKILRGEPLIPVLQSRERWNAQYKHGRWDYLLDAPYHASITAQMIRQEFSRQDKDTLRVLDIGCGNGSLLQELGVERIEYTGTDISDEAILQVQQRYPTATFLVLSMEELPITDKKYDVIVFADTLYYGHYRDILRAHASLLSDDGVMLISMYRAWRTRLIWLQIVPLFQMLQSVSVKNHVSGVVSRVIKGVYKQKSEL